MASSSGSTALVVIIGVVGGYALYRHLKGSHKRVSGYFTGAGAYGVDYLNPADATTDKRPSHVWYMKPYQIFNPGGGMRPMEIDAQGAPTGRTLVLPGEGRAAGGIMVGAAVDPHNCLCPEDIDPLNPNLPKYECSCHGPVAPHAASGWFLGRGGGGGGRGGGHFHQQQQQQQQQQDPMQSEQGSGDDPSMGQPQQQPQWGQHPNVHNQHGFGYAQHGFHGHR